MQSDWTRSRLTARHAAVAILDQMIAGQVGLATGARQLADMRHDLFGSHEYDKDFGVILALDSATMHLPVGAARRYWASSALAEKDQEIAMAENAARSEVVAACASLRVRFAAV